MPRLVLALHLLRGHRLLLVPGVLGRLLRILVQPVHVWRALLIALQRLLRLRRGEQRYVLRIMVQPVHHEWRLQPRLRRLLRGRGILYCIPAPSAPLKVQLLISDHA